MQVEVKLYGVLRAYRPLAPGLPHHPFAIELAPAATAADLAQRLALPDDLLAGLAVNQNAADLQVTLSPGDKISFFPPTAGG